MGIIGPPTEAPGSFTVKENLTVKGNELVEGNITGNGNITTKGAVESKIEGPLKIGQGFAINNKAIPVQPAAVVQGAPKVTEGKVSGFCLETKAEMEALVNNMVAIAKFLKEYGITA